MYNLAFYNSDDEELAEVTNLNANTNPQGGLVTSTVTGELPIPAAIWLLGPVLFGFLGLRHRSQRSKTEHLVLA